MQNSKCLRLNQWIFINSIAKKMAIFDEKIEIRERCKGVHCVDLGEGFQTHIYLQILASIQPRTSPLKFTASLAPSARAGPPRWNPRPGPGTPWYAELKGSIGEGPNHSNHSNHSNSFKIGIFRNFSFENFLIQKFQKISTFSKLSAKFRQNFIKIWAKINSKNRKMIFFAKFCQKMRKFSEILRSERCKSTFHGFSIGFQRCKSM